MLRRIHKRHFQAVYLSGKGRTNAIDAGRRTCILPDDFGSFVESLLKAGKRPRLLTFSSHNSHELRSEDAGRKDLNGSVKMSCQCADTHDFNLCLVSYFCSS